MSEKKINYIARDFEAVKEELLKYAEQYYPEVFDSLTDSTIGSWLIDLAASVGDDLNYHIDRSIQETKIDSANLRGSIMSMARSNGLKVPGRKASMCEVEISCELPINPKDISSPDWNYAPIVQRTSIVAAGSHTFELTEDVDFSEQFNKDGFSNRKIVPKRDSNGNIIGYTVTKSTIVIGGSTKVYKKVLYQSDVKPFMEIVLPEEDVMEVESIIFKETSEYTKSPQLYEYFIDEEQYRVSNDAVMTYRYFECDSLADQTRYGDLPKSEIENGVYDGKKLYEPSKYEDYTEGNGASTTRTSRYYLGEWKPLKQKFITEYTDNGYMKIIFGSGNGYTIIPDTSTPFAKYMASKIMNNDMLGILPRAGWSMYVLYRIGGGSFTNLAPDSINKIVLANIDWGKQPSSTNGSTRGKVIASLSVTNTTTAIGGKDAPSAEELKALIKYNTAAQNRAVTVNDYHLKLMQMPPRYGTPFRSSVIESNNKIVISILGLNSEGKLETLVPKAMAENIVSYMKGYKQINDYIEVKSGRIYNVGIAMDLFIDKNYNAADVIANVIERVKAYFDVNGRDMGENIYMGDLRKEINLVDGVVSLIDLRVYKLMGGEYSSDDCPLPIKAEGASSCDNVVKFTFTPSKGDESNASEIDLDAVDQVLVNDYNAMYEIMDDNDIQVRCKMV